MIETKLFEVKDVGTFIPCIGIRFEDLPGEVNEDHDYLLHRCGYYGAAVAFGKLDKLDLKFSSFEQPNHTMRIAHEWVSKHWSQLADGCVVDIEYVLGKVDHPKISERISL